MYKVLLIIFILIIGLESKVEDPVVAHIYIQESEGKEIKRNLKVISFNDLIPRKKIVVRSERFVTLLKESTKREELLLKLTTVDFIQKTLLRVKEPILESYWSKYNGQTLKYNSHKFYHAKRHNSLFDNFEFKNIGFSRTERIILVEFNMMRIISGSSNLIHYVEFDVVSYLVEGLIKQGRVKKYKIDSRILYIEFQTGRKRVRKRVEEKTKKAVEEKIKIRTKAKLVSIVKKDTKIKHEKIVRFSEIVKVRDIPDFVEEETDSIIMNPPVRYVYTKDSGKNPFIRIYHILDDN